MSKRACKGRSEDGSPCRQAPGLDSEFCFWHDPEHADEASEARRLGGKRAHKESALIAAYNLGGLDSAEGITRHLEMTRVEALKLQDPDRRVRALISIGRAASRHLEVHLLDKRFRMLEDALAKKKRR